MDNLLPSFKSFHLEEDSKRRQEKRLLWNPSSSLPRGTQYTSCFSEKKTSSDIALTSSASAPTYAVTDSQPPNKRYLMKTIINSDSKGSDSPLSASERGHVVPPVMKQRSAAAKAPSKNSKKGTNQAICVRNGGGVGDIQLFFTGSAIKSIDLVPGAFEERIINGSKISGGGSERFAGRVMDMFITTTRRLVTVMSLRQEIRTFSFRPGPLGMVVELKNGKLCCTSTLPGSQASSYHILKDSEPLSINGRRVVSLLDFETALGDAQRAQSVQLEVLLMKEKKLPYEDLIGVNIKNKKVSNLFKNVLNKSKGAKRAGRFRNMTLEVSDDEDDDDDDSDDHVEEDGAAEKSSGSQANSKDIESSKSVDSLRSQDQCSGDARPQPPSEPKWMFNTECYNSSIEVASKVDVELKNVKSTINVSAEIPTRDPSSDEDDDNDNASVTSTLLASHMKHRSTGYILHSIATGSEVALNEQESKAPSELSPTSMKTVEEEKYQDAMEEKRSADVGVESNGKKNGEKTGEGDESEPNHMTSVGWDYATALECGDLTTHLKLLCVPSILQKSENGWGDPPQTHLMNFVNVSTEWDVELFWVGEDSALVSRSILEENETHIELMSSEHVWCLTARRHVIEDLEEVEGSDVEIEGTSSVSVLFRPPMKNLENVIKRCIRVMWIPWVSLSFAETTTQLARDDEHDFPDIDFKIFDHSATVS